MIKPIIKVIIPAYNEQDSIANVITDIPNIVDEVIVISNNSTDNTEINAKTIDTWAENGWEWAIPISHEVYEKAQRGDWSVVLTPKIPVPKDWFCDLSKANLLGLASGGGQQMPIFKALGANCTVMDISDVQLQRERDVAKRENYDINIVKADMTQTFPFDDESFDIIFHPVANCYNENVYHVWKECYRVLKKGGILLAGLDNGLSFAFDEEETKICHKLPYNPLKDKALYNESIKNEWGVQFSHTIEEQIDGQLRAGFNLTNIYQDINTTGLLHDFNVPTFYATRVVK